MKFREYENITCKTITAKYASSLDKKIEELGKKYNIIDLQFSTNDACEMFSALLLIREK